MDAKAKSYFEQSLKYSLGDVEKLLKGELDCAGPLLMVICNGIDNFGGICFGFSTRVGIRSVKFMKDKMSFNEPIANLLYKVIRLGVVHQGMPKIGLRYFVDYYRPDKGKIFYSEPGGYVYLNVVELAYAYLDALKNIEKDPAKHVTDFPPPDTAAKNAFDSAILFIQDDIQSYCDACQKADDRNDEERLSRGEIDHKPSLSAYTADMLNLSMELPPPENS